MGEPIHTSAIWPPWPEKLVRGGPRGDTPNGGCRAREGNVRFVKSRTVAAILLVFVGLTSAQAQSEMDVSWEIRNYYIDADNPQVEVLLVLRNAEETKVLVFFGPGEALETSESGQYRLSVWFGYTTYDYRLSVDKGSIRVLKQESKYSREVRNLVPVPPGWQEIKRIPITAGKVVIGSAETIPAKQLFHRPLSLQAKRMNGDDVWALQRFLVEQGYQEAGVVDGWFGPNTEKALRRFQTDKQITVDGVVGQAVWDVLSGLEEEQVNFPRIDYDEGHFGD
jgi:peptidoglycan hydrolase-like protein with peptidoglycan-binding domain